MNLATWFRLRAMTDDELDELETRVCEERERRQSHHFALIRERIERYCGEEVKKAV